jgi:hypothetical protein
MLETLPDERLSTSRQSHKPSIQTRLSPPNIAEKLPETRRDISRQSRRAYLQTAAGRDEPRSPARSIYSEASPLAKTTPRSPSVRGRGLGASLRIDKLETLWIKKSTVISRPESASSGINDDFLASLDRVHQDVDHFEDPFGSFAVASQPSGSPAWSSISFESLPVSEENKAPGFEKLRSALDSADSLDPSLKEAVERLLGGSSDLSALRSQRRLLEFRN